MYADTISDSMKEAIEETQRRRTIQDKYNKEHNIIPKTIIKEIRDVITNEVEVTDDKVPTKEKLSPKEKQNMILKLKEEMKKCARELDFERAMELRDIIFDLEDNK